MNTTTPFGYPKHKEATKKMNRSVKHGQKRNDKKCIVWWGTLRRWRPLQSHLPARVSILSLCDTHDATRGNGGFTQRCTELSSEKLKRFWRGGTRTAFFSFTLGLCPSLSPPAWMPLWAHLGGGSGVMLYNCFLTCWHHWKILGVFKSRAFWRLIFFAFITKPQGTVLSQVRSTVQSQSVQLERQSFALFCGLI